jgi:outer membrane immunogenic protein
MMMKKTIGVTSLLVISGIVHAATTSTVQTKWSGFYAGLNGDAVLNYVDMQSNNASFTGLSGTCDKRANFASFSPGAQIGFVHQFNSNLVLGIEGDFNYNTNQRTSLNCTCPINPGVSDSFVFNNRMQGSLLGRLGYTFRNSSLLPFFTAGGSLANLGLKYHNEHGDYYSANTTKAGWVVGVGMEWRMLAAWSLRAEYSYVSYSDVKMHVNTIYSVTDPNGAARAALHTNNVELAINYWI